MKLNIGAILPNKISDEAAYHLVTFMIDLTAALEFRYIKQIQQYIDNGMQSDLSD